MKLIQLLLASLFVVSFNSCGENTENAENNEETADGNQETVAEDMSVLDEHTLSNYFDVKTTHLHLDIAVSFEEKKIKGSVTHTLENVNGVNEVIFDTKALNILGVTTDGGNPANYEMGEYDELLGTPLKVEITPETKTVEIEYETTEGTEALDWLMPAQTAGKQQPFMYTQGQSIFTRSWIPVQGTPAIRITYSARVQVPTSLMAVMSASNPVQKNETGIYSFDMPQPIPCYLLALAVGDLEFAPIDYRTGVYTEPSMLEDCAYELADMGKMVSAAEKLYGKYLWDRYDVIVLPPSFPFGGMENPRLTFATPTIIAGDRSLVALIAHELAHSWSGNLVTNSTWNDFWLNEGFTVYFERRIMESLYGKDYTDMLALLGYQDLMRTMSEEEPAMQSLKLNLINKHPDDAMSDVAYEKGYFFLRLLEQVAGRDNFDAFLKAYFDEHKFQTITTEEFVEYLNTNLIQPHNLTVNVDEWVYGEGVPENCPKVVSTRFNAVEASIEQFYQSGSVESIQASDWTTHEWLHFIRHLKDNTTPSQMAMLDEKFHLTQSGNSEIAAIWFEKSINFGYDSIDKELEAFLIKVGRRKFLMPLYTALAATPEGKEKALAIYAKARSNYHYVSFNSIDQLLGYQP
ncbi:MAG: M1 family metallopeptidase [Flavobacteriales bacterium]|nr:M1 family metallopeptidase [Flavobacteriales bacterium]MCB9196325.1 M1 family metallopeptidase [Flavobacteriales bacterium]